MTYELTHQEIWEEFISTRLQAVEKVRDWISGYINSPDPEDWVICSIGDAENYNIPVWDLYAAPPGGYTINFCMLDHLGGCESLDVRSDEFKTIRDVLEFLNEAGLVHLLDT
jgi:hypothetical protein